MTHEQRIKALIEAGEKATAGYCCPEWMATAIRHVVRNCDICCEDIHEGDCGGMFPGKYDGGYLAQAANARESIKLLAEIAEAAGKYRAAAYLSDQEFDVPSSETQSHANARSLGRKFDALLAKYKEAQDAE